MLKKSKLIPLVLSGATGIAASLVAASCSFHINPLKIEDGTNSISAEIGSEGQDTHKFTIKVDDKVQTKGIVLKAVPTNYSNDEDSFIDKISFTEDNCIKWKAFTEADVGAHAFKILVSYESFQCYSDIIAFSVTEPSYEQAVVEGGLTFKRLTYAEAPGWTDANPWVMYVDGQPQTDAIIKLVTTSSCIGLNPENHKLYVTNEPTPGDHSATIQATSKDGAFSASANVTISISEQDVYTVTGGSTNITGQAGVAGSDAGTWKLLLNGTDQGVTFTIDGTAPTGVSLVDNKLTWDNAAVANTYTFTVSTTVGTTTYTSDTITLKINPADVYTVTGGSTNITGQAGVAGEDAGTWKLLLNGADQGVTFTIDGTPPTGVSLVDNKLTWDNTAVANTYTFTVSTTVGATTYTSDTITLKINPADTYLVSGGSQNLSGVENIDDTDGAANIWKYYKNGVAQETTSEEIVLVNPTPLPTDMTISISSGIVSWTNPTEGDYTFQVKLNEDATNLSPIITLHIESDDPTDIVVSGDSLIDATDPNVEFAVTAYPGGEDITAQADWDIEWHGATGTQAPIFDTTPGKENHLITYTNSIGTATITAELENVATDTFDIEIKQPHINSDEIWGIFGAGDNAKWATINPDSLTGSGNIEYKTIGAEAWTTGPARTAFDQEIYIGSDVAEIPNDFLNGCSTFNSPITFANDNKCFVVGDNFMSGCEDFNETLTLPNTVRDIGANFMYGCTDFANNRSADAAGTLALPTNLKNIGDGFLYECKSFNSNITIGTGIQYIGNTFMFGCEAMSSGTAAGVVTFASGFDYRRIASSTGLSISFAITYAEGSTHSIIIDCSGDTALKAGLQGKFPNLGSTTGFYRAITYR